MEILNMEKECIGCYVSGNPLDDYKKAIERAVTLKSSNIQRIAEEQKASQQRMIAGGAKPWQLRDSTKSYTALGMLTDLHQIRTKKGDDMAFAKLADLTGQIDCTFFPKVWEQLKDKIQDEGVYAFKGKVDGSLVNKVVREEIQKLI
jgi:DNA polymerase-3 subunit alpha